MKLSLNWVREYTKITMTPDELMERISVSLTEVESMEEYGERFSGITVAQVENVEPHPVADNLLVLKLDVGKTYVTSIVQKCLVKKGDKVAYLPPGTIIPGEIGLAGEREKVKEMTVKGVESQGMVPSGRELGLNHDHTTVYTLKEDATVGTPLNQELKLVDYILEIKNKALTHRPDTFSIEGLAREIAAIQGTPYKPLDWLTGLQNDPEATREDRLPVRIENQVKTLCPRYAAVVLDNVEIGPSPRWMQLKLAKLGVRPVNNVVDISNYLMLEVGQPSHAFDYDKVTKKDPAFDGEATITVRLAKGGEKITTLDGQQRELHDDSVIIADSSSPIGVAGVMGGLDTEIDENTKRVIFQVENLDMYSVRRTSMKLGITSDAVTRFSKGLDPNRVGPTLYKGIQLLEEFAGATVASKVRDDYSKKVKPHTVTISPDIVRLRVGQDISDSEMIRILERLGLPVSQDKKHKTLTVTIPTRRRDLHISQDIEEEIVRIYGYDRLKPTLPVRTIHPVSQDRPRVNRIRMKDILSSLGANETYTYSFVGKDLYEACSIETDGTHILTNPISPELKYMRPLLVPSLLEKIPLNLPHREQFALYEVDMVNPAERGDTSQKELPEEPWHIGLAHTVSFYHAKQYLEGMMDRLTVKDYEIIPVGKVDSGRVPEWVSYTLGMYHPVRVSYIETGGEIVGVLGQIHPSTVEKLGLPLETSAWEVRCDLLEQHISAVPTYRDPSKYPAVVHDFSFVTENSVPYKAIVEAIRDVDKNRDVIRKVECVDIYESNTKKNDNIRKTTLRVTFQRDDATMEESDIESYRHKIVQSVEKKVGGTIAK